ncbi:hypothetical protein BYI23_E003000 (plasmid) [Burkholderia sp. YI23]|nr:hypothetical protein BYI23_E003000 [Burkholderia sp. YI23]
MYNTISIRNERHQTTFTMFRLPTRVSAPAGFVDPRFLGVVGPQLLEIGDSAYALTRFELGALHRLFVITELADNGGQPLSFAAEQVATEVLRRYGTDLEPCNAVFVEHYDPGVSFRSAATACCERFLEWNVTWRNRRAVFIQPKPICRQGTH